MKLTMKKLKKLIHEELEKIGEVRGTDGMQNMSSQELADEIEDVEKELEIAEKENNQRKVKRLKKDLEKLKGE